MGSVRHKLSLDHRASARSLIWGFCSRSGRQTEREHCPMITLQARVRAGFCVSEAYTQKLPSLKVWAVLRKIFCGKPLSGTGKGITNCLSGSSTPRFFVKNKKSVPSGVLKMQSLACIFALRAGLVGARNLPLRFDSTQLAGAVRANPHQLRWRGLARSSCDLVRVNSFLSPSLLPRRAGQVDRIEAAKMIGQHRQSAAWR